MLRRPGTSSSCPIKLTDPSLVMEPWPDGNEEASWLKRPEYRDRVSMVRLASGLAFHARGEPTSGMLVWYGPGKFGAFSPNYKFSSLGKGKYRHPTDGPLGFEKWPKGDFLMLLAARGGQIEGEPKHPEFEARSWRRLAVLTRLAEVERERGEPISDEHRERALDVAESESKFEDHLGKILVTRLQGERASQEFQRIAGWIAKIEEMERQGIPPMYQRFFRAVEAAAAETYAAGSRLPIPVQKDVQKIFEDGLTENQLGEATSFKSLLKLLKFDWLPGGGRGPGLKKRVGG
jgi:hypothetical protein